MKQVHVVGAGGVAGLWATRCLKDHYDVTGHDMSPYGEAVMEARQDEPWNSDMILPVPDAAVASKYGDSDLSFVCDQNQVKLCQNKHKCTDVLGDLAPQSWWVRDIKGAGAKGAMQLSDYLPGRNVSVEFCYNHGELIGMFMKDRLSYLVKGKEMDPTTTGSSAVNICINEKEPLSVATQALYAVSDATGTPLHGFYGVDLRQDKNDVFRVTEINPGRLLTASYVYYAMTGYNLLLAGVKAFLKEDYILGDYPEGYGVIRQTDSLPKIFKPHQTKEWK